MTNRHALLGLLCAGLLVSAAAAQESDPTRQLQNLVFYAHAGQLTVSPQFTASLQDSGETDNDLGVETTSRDTAYYRANLGLTYGVIDRLRLGVSETELFDQSVNSTNEKTGAQSTSDSHGFSDPTFTAAWRYAERRARGFYADAALSVTPALGHALAAGNGQDGNDLANAWNATLQAPFYWYLGRNELEAEAQASRDFGGLASGASAKTSTYTSPYWSGSALLQDRLHLTRAWFLQPGVTITLPYSYHTHSQAAAAVDTQHQVGVYASPALTLGYLPAPWCLLTAQGAYSYSPSTALPVTGVSTTSQNSQSYATLRATFLF